MEIKSITGAMTISENAPDYIIDPELQAMIAPLTTDEATMLEENIIIDGTVREPLTVWGRTIVDGHHRWSILQRNPDIPFTVQYVEFPDRQSAVDWMICNQLGRRNVTDEQRKYLLGKIYDMRKSTHGGDRKSERAAKSKPQSEVLIQSNVAAEIAAEQHVSKATVERAAQYARGLDAAEAVCPGFKDKILTGEIKSIQSDIADLRKLPESELLEAVRRIENGERPVSEVKAPAAAQPIREGPAAKHRYCPVDDPRIIPEDNATKGLERINESNRKMRTISDDDDEMTVDDIQLEFQLAREDAENLLRAVWDRDHALIMNNPKGFLEQLVIMSRTVRGMKRECCPEVREPEYPVPSEPEVLTKAERIQRIEEVNNKTRDPNNTDALINADDAYLEIQVACEDATRIVGNLLATYQGFVGENPRRYLALLYDAIDTMESLCEQYGG